MLDAIPNMQIVPLDKCVVHELHDDQRTSPLIEKLNESGILKNPPILTPFLDNSGRFMVLDGANRTTALLKMGYPHVVAQVIEADSPGLEMQTWNHVIWGMSTEKFVHDIFSIPNLDVYYIEDQEDALRQLWNHKILIYIQTPDLKVLVGTADNQDVLGRLEILHNVMDTYKNEALLDRTRVRNIGSLLDLYENLTALLVYPLFKVEEVLQLCGDGHLFPAGVTRFIVAPRALRINYPLNELSADKPVEEKNAALKSWIQEKVANKGLRFYSEPTVLFDE